jgi:uncharacterized membrane protein YdjX (TVP38/TMEM64 family)
MKMGLAGFVGGVAILGLLGWRLGLDLTVLKGYWAELNAYLVENPVALFVALVILPGLPIPASALLVTAGVVWRAQPVMACGLAFFAIALNVTWTYWLAAGLARNLVEKMLSKTKIAVPELPKGNHLKLILILKLTPGIPFFFANYLLGFLRAPFALFLPISLLSNGIIGSGIVLGGAGLADGNLKLAKWAILLVGVGVVLIQLVRRWLGRSKADGAES